MNIALPRLTVADILAAREELARRNLGGGIPSLADLRNPARYKGAWGGRGSGKSHTMAELVVLCMLEDPDASVVCIREIQKSLTLSAKKLIANKITQWQLDHLFEIQQTLIKRLNGKGLCIFQGMQDHTAESIKSLEGFKLAWAEEAQSLSERSMELLRPTIRMPGSTLMFSWNPNKRSDAVEKLLRPRGRAERENAIVRRANYTDNPFLQNDRELLDEAEDSRLNDDPETYAHIWLGAYQAMGNRVVIPPAWVESAVGLVQDLGLTVSGKKRAGLDVAGSDESPPTTAESNAQDDNALAGMYGIELQLLDTWGGLDTGLTTQRAVKSADEFGADEMFYDSAGVGEGVTGEWGGMGRRNERPTTLKVFPWNGGSGVLEPEERIDPKNPRSPLNKNQYQNLKAQAWFHLRKKFENAHRARTGRPYDPEMLISLPRDLPNLAELQDELSQPIQKPSATGKTMVDKQPGNTRSPNLADALVIANFPLPPEGYDWKAAFG